MRRVSLVRALAALLTAVGRLALPATASALTPTNGGSVAGTLTVIANTSADETDPHVTGPLVSYTERPPFGLGRVR